MHVHDGSGSRREIWKYDDFWCIKNIFGYVLLCVLPPDSFCLPLFYSFSYTENYVAWLRVLLMTAACCGVCDGFFSPRLLSVACCQLMSSLWQSHVASPPTTATATTTTTCSVWRWWIASTLFGQGKGCRQKDCSNGLFCRNFSQSFSCCNIIKALIF